MSGGSGVSGVNGWQGTSVSARLHASVLRAYLARYGDGSGA